MKKGILVGFALCFALSSGGAIAYGNLGMFSRANCGGFNETVSWDPVSTWYLATESFQENVVTGEVREFREGPAVTGRSYAGCFVCGFDWYVEGVHYAGYQESEAANEFLWGFCEAGFVPQQGDIYYEACKYSAADSCNITEW